MLKTALLLALVLASAACQKTPEPDTKPAAEPPKAAPLAATPGGDKSRPDDVSWDAPAAWKKVDHPSKMRKATYQIPRAEGDNEDAEMSVIQAGGSLEMNISRWAGQFGKKPEDVRRSERKVGDLKVTIVEIMGTFAGSGMPGVETPGPKPNQALLGAIVDTSTPTFFKLTGPEKTVTAARGDFDKLVESLRAK